MVHTLKDYTSKHRLSTVFGQIDNGEQSVRLGSINMFDRRGNVVFLDDFEGSTLFWGAACVGASCFAGLTSAWGKSGSQCMELTAGTGGAGESRFYREFYVPVVGDVGAESSFTVNANTDGLYMLFQYYTGDGYYNAGVKYDRANTKIQYMNSAGSWADLITSYELNTTTQQFNTWKIVMDLAKQEYVRILINDKEEDMAGTPIKHSGSGGTEHLYIRIGHDAVQATPTTIYIDNVILTINES